MFSFKMVLQYQQKESIWRLKSFKKQNRYMVSNFQAAVKQMFLYSQELFMKNKSSNVFFSVFFFGHAFLAVFQKGF